MKKCKCRCPKGNNHFACLCDGCEFCKPSQPEREGVEDWEKEAVGENVHSVYVHCLECRSWGINMPLDRKCECGEEGITYYDHKTISKLLKSQAKQIRQEERNRAGKIIQNLKHSLINGFRANDDELISAKQKNREIEEAQNLILNPTQND